jgi:hypothetical protein
VNKWRGMQGRKLVEDVEEINPCEPLCGLCVLWAITRYIATAVLVSGLNGCNMHYIKLLSCAFLSICLIVCKL